MTTESEKQLERLKKLLALAASTVNPHETELAGRKAAQFLDAHPLPVRWFVREGTEVRVVPAAEMTNLGRASQLMRRVKLHKANWFFEANRVKATGTEQAFKAGCFYFERYGYAVFVPIGSVEVYF